MIIDRYLFKEIRFNLFAVLSVLLLIFASKHFVRYMSDAASGSLPTEFIFKLLSLFTLSYLVLIVPFSLYIAILITLGRLYKDSEMTAFAACGIGIPRVTRSAFWFSVVLAVVMSILSLWVSPWAERKQYEMRDQAASESEVSFIAPGRFHEIRGGQGVFYIESVAPDEHTMREIFVHLEDNGKTDVFSADAGFHDINPVSGTQYIVLQGGHRLEILPEFRGYRVHQYVEAGVQIAQPDAAPGQVRTVAKPTEDLLGSDDLADIAELQWRISMPIACILLTVLAVLLSKTDPRQGRFSKLFIALVIYLFYVYMMMLTRAWIAKGMFPASIGLWWLHGVVLGLILVLMYFQFGWRSKRLSRT